MQLALTPTRIWSFFILSLLSVGTAHAVTCQNNLIASSPDEIFLDHGNGTLTDTRTDLMWKKCAEGMSGADCSTGWLQTVTWAEALSQAESSAFADYDDWRLPNVKELLTLVERCRFTPAINNVLFPHASSTFYWSGSPYVDDSTEAWAVDFDDGEPHYVGREWLNDIRLVRDADETLPVPLIKYIAFVEGNPLVAGDGVFVDGGPGRLDIVRSYQPSSPLKLGTYARDGLQLSVFSNVPPSEMSFYVNVGFLNQPSQCSAVAAYGGNILTQMPTTVFPVNGILGNALYVDPGAINELYSIATRDCPDAFINDFIVRQILVVDRLQTGQEVRLDAAAAGMGQSQFPSTSTPPPM